MQGADSPPTDSGRNTDWFGIYGGHTICNDWK